MKRWKEGSGWQRRGSSGKKGEAYLRPGSNHDENSLKPKASIQRGGESKEGGGRTRGRKSVKKLEKKRKGRTKEKKTQRKRRRRGASERENYRQGKYF